MKKHCSFLFVIVLMIVLVLSGCAKPTPAPIPTPSPTPVPVPTKYGTVEVRATDAPPTGVSKIIVYTKNIQVHKADSPEDTWTTVVGEERSFDLVEIQGAEVFLGTANITSGNYTQIRLDVTKVMVTLEGKEILAKLPSEKLKIVRTWEVRENEKTILALDFEADKFVVITGKDEAQVKPVLKLEVTQGDRPLKTAAKLTTLENITWVLQSYGQPGNLKTVLRGTEVALKDAEIMAFFDSAKSQVGGSAGINKYAGGYKLEGNKLSIPGPLITTAMAGPQPLMVQEKEYLTLLQAAQSYQIKGGELQINCGQQVLIFTKKTETSTSIPTLENTDWVLESYGQVEKLQSVLKDTEITALFDSAKSQVAGSAGVNRYFGSYKLDGSKLTVPGPIGSTKMAGPQPAMDQESEYLATLQAAESYKIEGSKLTITCSGKVLIFRKK